MPIILLLALLLASTNGHANRAERRHAKVSGFTRRWISILETAEYLNITERTVREMIRDGRLTGYRNGKIVRLDLAEVHGAMQPYGGSVV